MWVTAPHTYIDCYHRTTHKNCQIADSTPESGYSTMCSSARRSAEVAFVGVRGKLLWSSWKTKSKESYSALHMSTSRFVTMNSYLILLLSTAAGCVWLARSFIQWLRYPAAPGPAIAAYTNYWYIWKVWQGKFEDWNIKQHAQHGKLRAAMHQLCG